jgi:hypothetical protein
MFNSISHTARVTSCKSAVALFWTRMMTGISSAIHTRSSLITANRTQVLID